MIKPNKQDIVVDSDGRRSLGDLKIMLALYEKVLELEGRLDAIAAVTAPTGGATIDAESRTAINDILASAS